jgi:hypothetical protein
VSSKLPSHTANPNGTPSVDAQRRALWQCPRKQRSPVKARAPSSRVTWRQALDELARWRQHVRPWALREIARRARGLRWSPELLMLLLEELGVDDRFAELCGHTGSVPLRQAPQAIVIALAVRNSWSRADLFRFARRVGVSLPAAAFEIESRFDGSTLVGLGPTSPTSHAESSLRPESSCRSGGRQHTTSRRHRRRP